ncbi:MAG: NAD(P)H-binding protein [Intrasporangium sp.]|uniref:NAD(P)-dependent oxidoreductase n=1 Tax=Intrasporangium sp. TaxID=1925024 RepID=UPI0026493A3F|nr:NAD(P)H-binding protein [Intrasporangium sp.]MDN5794291.1 NAD(P)H-binding protein [Intrasporangium sp.]
MARIAIIGGHGKVALLAAPILIAAGHDVVSIVRNPDHVADVEQTGARAQVADVETLDEHATEDLVRGFDAVVWSAGAGGGSPERTYAVDRDAAIRTIDAASRAGARRFVMVSYFRAGPDHGVAEGDSLFPYAQAKADADAHLAAGDLDWTILQPSLLTTEPGSGKVDVGPDQPTRRVSRANVAAAIAVVLASPTTYRRVYEFNDGSTPIADAFTGADAD